MHYTALITLLTACLLLGCIPEADSSKILAVFPFPGRSHFGMTNVLMRELVQQGHEVTMITAFSMAPYKLGSNFKEILIEPTYDFWSDIKHLFKAGTIFEMSQLSAFDFMRMCHIIGLKTTEHAMKQPGVQAIINATQTAGVYDLLLAEQFYQEAFLALGYKYNIPTITVTTYGFVNYLSQMMGIMTPWSYVPHSFLPYSEHMTFWQRFTNSYYSLWDDLNREFYYFPQMDALVQQYFSHLPVKIPTVSQMEKNVSLMLLNCQEVNMAIPRSNNMIYVGGLHISPPKALPTEMKKFIDDAKDGVIYFSLGTQVQSKDMPTDILQSFLDVFAGLKQRVIWKFENESIQNLPSNVMIKKWMPQNDILAHPNVKVFITHGGLFGTQEGIHYAKPMLGIPVYCDQHINMYKAEQGGYGISLHFHSITQEQLKNSLNQLLYNATYRQSINRISSIFRDRPLSARESAMYWIEYVIRHKGAPHLRSAGMDLKWYEFYLVDVMAFVAGSCFLGVVVLVLVLRRLFSFKSNVKMQNSKKTKVKRH